jgi:hypothetical protein
MLDFRDRTGSGIFMLVLRLGRPCHRSSAVCQAHPSDPPCGRPSGQAGPFGWPPLRAASPQAPVPSQPPPLRVAPAPARAPRLQSSLRSTLTLERHLDRTPLASRSSQGASRSSTLFLAVQGVSAASAYPRVGRISSKKIGPAIFKERNERTKYFQ